MRLIDADALMEQLVSKHAHSWGKVERAYGEAIEALCNAPTVDAESVRHGEWISTALVDQKGRVIVEQYKCSLCGRHEYRKEPYCHCGAKMR